MQRRTIWIGVGVGVAVIAAAGITTWALSGSEDATARGDGETTTIRGAIDITNCAAIGYGTVGPGEQIIVTDAAGNIVATSELGPPPAGSVGESCEYDFTVESVPDGSDFYTVEVGNLDPVTVSSDELQDVAVVD